MALDTAEWGTVSDVPTSSSQPAPELDLPWSQRLCQQDKSAGQGHDLTILQYSHASPILAILHSSVF